MASALDACRQTIQILWQRIIPSALAWCFNASSHHVTRATRSAYRDRWWQFGEKQSAMYEMLRGRAEVSSIAQTSRTLSPAVVPNVGILAQTLVVFTVPPRAFFPLIANSLHQAWALLLRLDACDQMRCTPHRTASLPFRSCAEHLHWKCSEIGTWHFDRAMMRHASRASRDSTVAFTIVRITGRRHVTLLRDLARRD